MDKQKIKDNQANITNRIVELDALRGLSIILMVFHHLIHDIRFIFGIDAFAWQTSYIFRTVLRAPFLFLFLFISGISSNFSKSNSRRALKLALASIVFSVAFFLLSKLVGDDIYLVINIILLLAIGTSIFYLLEQLALKEKIRNVDLYLIILSAVIFLIGALLNFIPPRHQPLLYPFHKVFTVNFATADYLPIFPWLSFFFFGVAFGRKYYSCKKSLLPKLSPAIRNFLRPFAYAGRNSLAIYILHQPVTLAVLYMLRLLKII